MYEAQVTKMQRSLERGDTEKAKIEEDLAKAMALKSQGDKQVHHAHRSQFVSPGKRFTLFWFIGGAFCEHLTLRKPSTCPSRRQLHSTPPKRLIAYFTICPACPQTSVYLGKQYGCWEYATRPLGGTRYSFPHAECFQSYNALCTCTSNRHQLPCYGLYFQRGVWMKTLLCISLAGIPNLCHIDKFCYAYRS